MRFYPQQDLPLHPADIVFRQASWPWLLVALVVVGSAGVAGTLAWLKGVFLLYIPAGFCLLVSPLCWQVFWRTLGPANWLVRYRPERLLIKFRSYLNTHFPEEDTIAFELATSEIAWVRRTVEWRHTVSSRGGKQSRRQVYLDIKPVRDDLSDLQRCLDVERRVPGKTRYGSSRYNDYSVRIIEGGIIRIAWTGVTPRSSKALAILAQTLPVREPERASSDFTSPAADAAGLEQQVRQLLEAGDSMGAIRLVRTTRCFSLTEAKQFVERIRDTPGPSAEG